MSYVANTTIDEFNDIIENHANVRALHAFAVGRVCHSVVSMQNRINMLNFKLDCIKNVVSRLMFQRNYFISFDFYGNRIILRALYTKRYGVDVVTGELVSHGKPQSN